MTMLWINVRWRFRSSRCGPHPMWLVLRRPDAKPTIAAAPAVRTLPAVRYEDAASAASPSPACGRASRGWPSAPGSQAETRHIGSTAG